MKKIVLISSILLICEFSLLAQNANNTFSLGQIDTITSKILAEIRVINIYLPEGYNKSDSISYPVIYLLDGSKDEDFIHVAGLVQYLSFPWINQRKPSIVVGISNIDRRRDFTFPTTIQQYKTDFPTSGSSEKFISFIEKELQPHIDKNFITNSNKTLIGQSLGGLLATEILFKKPQLFSNYIIVSPSLWWDNESILKSNQHYTQDYSKINVHVSVGNEGKIMINDAKALFKSFRSFEKSKAPKAAFKFYGDMKHETIYHIALYNALTWLNSQE